MRAVISKLSFCALIAAFYRADAASFSDANFVSLGTMPGADGTVYAVIKEPISGALYIGGGFRGARGAVCNGIANWDGTNWSAFGAGLGGTVRALAIDSSGNLYAGGAFTNTAA